MLLDAAPLDKKLFPYRSNGVHCMMLLLVVFSVLVHLVVRYREFLALLSGSQLPFCHRRAVLVTEVLDGFIRADPSFGLVDQQDTAFESK